MRIRSGYVLFFLFLTAACPIAFCQQGNMALISNGGGFGTAQSGRNGILVSSLGQTFVGAAQHGNTFLEAGFLVLPFLRGSMAKAGGEEGVPLTYALSQNFPNPFNPSTTIRYKLPHKSYVTIWIYNVLGQKVTTLVDQQEEAGRYAVVWKGRNDAGVQLSSGVYFYRFEAENLNSHMAFASLKKMMLLK